MNKPKLFVVDDYEGELALSPALARLRQLADVTIFNHPIADYSILIVSIHLRLSDESRGLMDREILWKMRSGAILINTWRSAIIDQAALIDALHEKRIAGAGLDMFTVEPLPASSPLWTMPNALLTPHVGWQVRDIFHEFVEIAADQLDAWLKTNFSKAMY